MYLVICFIALFDALVRSAGDAAPPHPYACYSRLRPEACDRLEAADIDRAPRGRDKASDHTPVWARLADQARINAPYGAPEGEAAA